MAKSNFLRNALLNHAMGKTSFTMPSQVFAGLLVTAPTAASTGSNVSQATYTGYARVQVPAASLNSASNGVMTNSADIVWPEVQSGSDTIVAVGFFDAASGGNMLYFDDDVGNVEVSITQTPPTVKDGALTITEE